MASRPLGLGSRARVAYPSTAKRPTENPSTALVRSAPPAKRRGFGLFYDSDGDSDMGEARPPPVRFNDNISGFESVRNYASSGDESAQRRTSSRRSKHTTPSKSRSARPARRQTPYSSTTGRALARARKEKVNTDDELMNRPIDSPFDSDDDAIPRSKRKSRSQTPTPTKFKMGGARSDPYHIDMDEEDALADIPTPAQRTPTKNLFSTNAKTTPTSRKSPKNMPAVTPSKTWGQWIKSIIPESAKKLVTTPAKSRSPSIFKTPKRAEEDVSVMPGSFEKTQPFVNPNILEVANSPEQKSPAPISNNLFNYNQSPITSPNFRGSRTTQNTPAKASVPASLTTPQRGPAPVSGATSMRKPSNFIQRLKSAKSTRRYDPYARPSKAPAKRLGPAEAQGLTAEEQLEALERRERDRRVQEAEDRYIRREALRKLGRDADITDDEGDRSMVDASVCTSPIKKKATTSGSFGLPPGSPGSPGSPSDESPAPQATTPPDTPPSRSSTRSASPEKNPFSSVPLFQPSAPPRTSPPASNLFSTGTITPPASFNSDIDDASDKENLSSPPPPPTMSHRQLPEPTTNAAPPPAPSSLFADKPQPVGGFGLSAPTSPAIPRFHRHQPRVGSSLRNEASTNENFDDAGKENALSRPSATSGAASGSGLKSKTFGEQTTTTNTTTTRGALGEMGSNSLAQGVKIDLRARVASLPVKDLAQLINWPVALHDCSFTYENTLVNDVLNTWTVGGREDWGRQIFGEAAKAVKV